MPRFISRSSVELLASNVTTSTLGRLFVKKNMMTALCLLGGAMAAIDAGPGTGELGAQQEDLRGVEDPEQQDDQRARCAERRGDTAVPDVKRDQVLAAG